MVLQVSEARLPSISAPIYLDYQASSPLDASVAEVICDWLRGRCGNPHSSEHAFGWAAHEDVERARRSVALLVDADPEDIFFTSGATEANNLALFGAAEKAPPDRDTILVSSIEHSSVIEPARELARRGFRVVELPVDHEGFLHLESLRAQLTHRVLLVSVAAVNNEVGTIQNLDQIGRLSRASGALFHTDAAQALSARSLPLGQLPVDLASLSSHKSYGPAGVGALYVAAGQRNRIAPQVLGGAQQGGLRAGTLPTALCVGFGRACEILDEFGQAERDRVAALRDQLWQKLRTAMPAPEVVLNGPSDFRSRHPGNLSVAYLGTDARDIVQRLQPHVACSTGSACHAGSEKPSHVLLSMGYAERRAQSTLRLSLGRQSTADEVFRAAMLVTKAANEVALSSR